MSRLLSSLAATALTLTTLTALTATAFAGDVTGSVSAPVPKNRAYAVVFVRNAGLEPATELAKMDQAGLLFAPRVVAVQKGGSVRFTNSDPVGHNVYTPDGEKYDLGTWPKGESKDRLFPTTGAFRQLCHVHDDMMGWVVVTDSKFHAVSDKAGAFELKGLPPGKYTLGIWHEKLVGDDVTVEVPATGNPPPVTFTLKPKA